MDCCGGANIKCEFSKAQINTDNISKKGQVMGVKEYKFADHDRHLLNEYHHQFSERTIAHELGHGIVGLEHVFENSSNSGKTKNLMDCSFEKDAIITIFFDILSNAPSQLTKQEKLFFVAQNKQYILDKLKNVAIDKSKMFEAYNTLDVKKVDWNLEFVSYILGLNF
ncbi:MAG: hypothetical protein IKQ70_03730 [Bacteroidales bacterium]|nr:hypothetical protein [Bacteroidales bacterium]